MRLLVVAVVVAAAATAYADSPHVAEARRAVDEVRYDDAQKLLVAAIQDGTNSPAAMIEIYELSATTAVVLDQKELAEQYYRRLLALQPGFVLADDVAPKLREPFVAAQAYLAAHGKLAVTATRTATGVDVEVTDPLGMAAGAAPLGGATVALDHGVATIATTDPAASIAIVDDRGNQLVIVPPEAITTAPLPAVHGPVIDRPAPRAAWYRRWTTWAIPTAAVAAIGTGFAIDAHLADNRLADILAHSGDHDFGDAESARARRDRSALLANISFATAGALAIVTAIVFVTRPHGGPTVIPTATADGAGVVVIW